LIELSLITQRIEALRNEGSAMIKKKEVESANTPEFLTPAQVAARWHWHQESVRRWLRQRKIESVQVGRRRLIPVKCLQVVEREGRIPALSTVDKGRA
jgi:excisionase family DNA binding protein